MVPELESAADVIIVKKLNKQSNQTRKFHVSATRFGGRLSVIKSEISFFVHKGVLGWGVAPFFSSIQSLTLASTLDR